MAIEPHNRHNPHDDDDGDDASSDTSSVLTELGADDFPGHFRESDGRLFHSHGNLPYPLPVDGDEQARLNAQHKILHDVLGSHVVSPVAQTLAYEPGRQKRVLDLCTGTGQWVMDMASQFRHVRFSGVDIVPIATRRPYSNAHFEILDVTQPLRWPDNMMDFVHARNVSLAACRLLMVLYSLSLFHEQIPNYPGMLQEATRVLRRGGVFFSGEIGRCVGFAPGYRGDPVVDAPGATRFLDIVNELLECVGLDEITDHIPRWLGETGTFMGGRIQEHLIPIGEWHSSPRQQALGRAYLDVMTVFADSLRPFLRDYGRFTERELDELIDGYVHDMRTVPGLVSVYHTVWAIKA